MKQLKHISLILLAVLVSLTSIDLSNCNALETIGENAFSEIENLEEINFAGCTSLKDLTSNALDKCFKLEEVNLSGCVSLEYVSDFLFKIIHISISC